MTPSFSLRFPVKGCPDFRVLEYSSRRPVLYPRFTNPSRPLTGSSAAAFSRRLIERGYAAASSGSSHPRKTRTPGTPSPEELNEFAQQACYFRTRTPCSVSHWRTLSLLGNGASGNSLGSMSEQLVSADNRKMEHVGVLNHNNRCRVVRKD